MGDIANDEFVAAHVPIATLRRFDGIEPRVTSGDDTEQRRNQEEHDDGYESADEVDTAPVCQKKAYRIEQANLFKEFALKEAADIFARQEERRQKRGALSTDGGLTIEQMMKEQSKQALDDPREYQLELFERAKQENTIAVLETGSGKTLIAVLLIRWILEQESEDRANGQPPRTVFFMVPSNTLVYQQTAVLRCNIDKDIASRSGDMNTSDPFERSRWVDRLSKNRVIVCTPEILHQCLRHSFVRMDQISLMIFDEAHHAKKKHPYAVIVEDFYKPHTGRKPRVFAMTASPVDSKDDLESASRELEALLDCKLATFPLAERYRNHAQEITLTYAPLQDSCCSDLWQALHDKIGHLPKLARLFTASLQMSSILGRWASDKFWEYALREEDRNRAESRLGKRKYDRLGVKLVDEDILHFQQAHELVRSFNFGQPKVDLKDLSSKVITLNEFLNEHYDTDLNCRCIVFVQQKAIARMLTEIFGYIGAKYLRPGLLTGNAAQEGDKKITFRQQLLTMTQFRKGEINCLFATSVAEEGLDVPDCNLVIRFDMYDTVIQYIQSKGRARHRNSKFVDLIEEGNKLHEQAQKDARDREAALTAWIGQLDPSRRIMGNEDTQEGIENVGRFFKHPTSGSKLTYWSALGVLQLFAATWPSDDRNVSLDPAYIVSPDSGGFSCEVIMPEHVPIRQCFGLRYPRKALAKRSAAFSMCMKLLEGGFLNKFLLSSTRRSRPQGANAHLAVNDKKTGKYAMQLKPSLWADGRGTLPTRLFLTVVDMPDGLDRPHQALGLLTRAALPQMPSFPLFLDSGKITSVQTKAHFIGFNVTADEVQAFTDYSLLLLNHVNAKIFENNAKLMSYWVVPIIRSWAAAASSRDCVDFTSINEAVKDGGIHKWTRETPQSLLANRFIVDPWAGNRRFYSVGVDANLKPLDDIPGDTAKYDRPGANRKKNILQYSISMFGKTFDEAWPKWDREQPVMECIQVLHRQNLLAPPAPKEKDRKVKAFLCPEPLYISLLSVDVVTMFLVFPPIIHRIEEYLIALEAADTIGIKIRPALALEAMTKDSDNSDDHVTDERINFRPGMGNNYERLEFMGDCFLKMATSISLFVLKPNDDEFEFHVHRMHMICNQNLMNHALNMNMTRFVRTLAFSRRLWYPEALLLEGGKGSGKTLGAEIQKHSLGEKSIADICEALIGAAFIEHNNPQEWSPHAWTYAILAVTNLVKDSNHAMKTWDDYVSAYKEPEWQKADATASQRELVDSLEQEQGYRFQRPRLLRSAFNHPSVPYNWYKVPCYQRLEFLGDSLLDLACITHLFYNFQKENPQWLTEHKMAMVSNKFLGAVCVKIGFHRHLRFQHPKLGMQIQEYVDEVELAREEAEKRGEADYWIHVKDPPKCLPDVVESYLGALLIDSGFNYALIQNFFDKHILPFFADMSIYDTFASNHPITKLHHTLSQTYGCHAYQLLCTPIDPDIIGGKAQVLAALVIHKDVIAAKMGESGRYVKERTSKAANDELLGLTPQDFKRRFGCDCNPEDAVVEVDVEMAEAGVGESDATGTAR